VACSCRVPKDAKVSPKETSHGIRCCQYKPEGGDLKTLRAAGSTNTESGWIDCCRRLRLRELRQDGCAYLSSDCFDDSQIDKVAGRFESIGDERTAFSDCRGQSLSSWQRNAELFGEGPEVVHEEQYCMKEQYAFMAPLRQGALP